MSWIKEIVFGRFTCLDRALKYPKRVRKLKLSVFGYSLLDYSENFKQFVNLESINLHVCLSHPIAFPDELCSSQKLHTIKILNYPLHEFPCCLATLPNLKFLYLRGHEIKTIPDFEEEAFKNLETFTIENCELEAVPTFLSRLQKLKSVSFAITKLIEVKGNSFPKGLVHLNIGFIETLEKIDFYKLPSTLKTLNICGSLFNYNQKLDNYAQIKEIEASTVSYKILYSKYD
jgi:Leucine-rich repeat (LRR) protein